MKAPPLRKLLESDMTVLGESGRVLLQAINPLHDVVAQALSRGMTLGDNLSCQLQALEFQVPPATVTFQHSWVAGTPAPSFARDASGYVCLGGVASNGTVSNSGTNGTIFPLPAGYRPDVAKQIIIAINDGTGAAGDVYAHLRIDTSGNVMAWTASTAAGSGNAFWVLDGVRFKAAGVPEPWASGVLFASTLPAPATHVVCAGLYNLSDKTDVTSFVQPGWRAAKRGDKPHVQILDWPGLAEGKRYRAQMIAFAEG